VRWVRVDAVQIQQVLINLVRNAIEAMKGSATKRVMIATMPTADGTIEVSVADTGPGFVARVKDSLFSPLDSSQAGGMGLGLSISRTIVEAHAARSTPISRRPAAPCSASPSPARTNRAWSRRNRARARTGREKPARSAEEQPFNLLANPLF
jgi:hypothetical protein